MEGGGEKETGGHCVSAKTVYECAVCGQDRAGGKVLSVYRLHPTDAEPRARTVRLIEDERNTDIHLCFRCVEAVGAYYSNPAYTGVKRAA